MYVIIEMESDVPIPPVAKFPQSNLSLKCLVRFKKVNNKLIEFFVVEPVEMAHPRDTVIGSHGRGAWFEW